MTLVNTIELAHLPNVAVHVALFNDVANASHLRSQLLQGNPDYEYAFLDVTTVRHCTNLPTCLLHHHHHIHYPLPPTSATTTPYFCIHLRTASPHFMHAMAPALWPPP